MDTDSKVTVPLTGLQESVVAFIVRKGGTCSSTDLFGRFIEDYETMSDYQLHISSVINRLIERNILVKTLRKQEDPDSRPANYRRENWTGTQEFCYSITEPVFLEVLLKYG